jgi:hypothetical protein
MSFLYPFYDVPCSYTFHITRDALQLQVSYVPSRGVSRRSHLTLFVPDERAHIPSRV